MTTTTSRRWLPDLALQEVRRHRGAILAWILAGGGIMWVFGAAYQVQLSTFPGGAKEFGASVAAAADAMRALVGPADSLDTYGGYVTFHNLGYAAIMLGFWALFMGSRAVRGAEERGEVTGWLATGRRRALLVLDEALGYLASMTIVVAAVGLMTWLGTLAAGQPQLLRSFGAIAMVALAASVFFALALLLSQLVGSSRTSSGIAGALMLATFLVANLNQNMGWWGWLRFISPFWYAQQSRLLIPGHNLDAGATIVLVAACVALTGAAALAFEARDVGAPLWSLRRRAPTARPFRMRRPWLSTTAGAALAARRNGLLLWFAGAAAWFALYIAMTPTILQYWSSSDLIRRMLGAMPATSLTDQYISYVVNLTAPLVTAFALLQAAAWVRDSDEKRTDMEMASPVSRRRLWLERIAALTGGATVLVAGCVAGMGLGAWAGGIALTGDGVLRAAGDLLLLAMATGAVGGLIVATLRSGVAIGVLGAFLGVSFFVTVFGPLFNWPAWVLRLSFFQAFGTPYTSAVELRDALFMAGVAVIGTAVTIVIAERRSTAP